MAAFALQRSNNWIGQYYRRIRARSGPLVATKATARKLAIIFYEMLKNKVEFIPIPMEKYEDNFKQYKYKYLERQASAIGYKLISIGSVS